MEEEQKQSTKNDIGENNNIGKDNEAYHVAKPSSDGNVVLTGITKFNGIYKVSYQSKTNFWETLGSIYDYSATVLPEITTILTKNEFNCHSKSPNLMSYQRHYVFLKFCSAMYKTVTIGSLKFYIKV